jgi:Ca2+-binding RTX toxin-like protein
VNHTARILIAALAAAATSLGVVTGSAHAGASISRVGTVLQITGDDASDRVRIDRDAGGLIRVDVGEDGSFEYNGPSSIANTSRIIVTTGGGDDVITLNEASGALPGATINGDEGNDTLTGGSGADELHGGPGDDTILSKGGVARSPAAAGRTR